MFAMKVAEEVAKAYLACADVREEQIAPTGTQVRVLQARATALETELDAAGPWLIADATSPAFREACLAPLGYTKLFAWEGGAGFGRDGTAALWLGTTKPTGIHIALSASDHAAVDAFHQATLHAGAIDNGKPGLRPDYHANYYAAFVIDPDGNNLEAVCHVAK
ncbi:VOC family protein [Paraburkholderia sediminicola]|uniref:VOC family protein n=1 Tax=Paraburkholderia sediminicola TaxID=458836 RepID=UPI0038B8B23E